MYTRLTMSGRIMQFDCDYCRPLRTEDLLFDTMNKGSTVELILHRFISRDVTKKPFAVASKLFSSHDRNHNTFDGTLCTVVNHEWYNNICRSNGKTRIVVVSHRIYPEFYTILLYIVL